MLHLTTLTKMLNIAMMWLAMIECEIFFYVTMAYVDLHLKKILFVILVTL